MPGSMMQPDMSVVANGRGVRADALARWQDGGWPGSRVEAWRYTRIDSLAKINAHMSSSNISLNSDALRHLAYLECNAEALHKIL